MTAALDGLAGPALLGVAVLLLRRSPGAAGIAALASLAWFVAPWAGPLLLVHRPLLLHLALGYPTGRLRGRVAMGAVAAAWLEALWQPLGRHPAGMLLLGVLTAAAAVQRARTAGSRRPEGDVAVLATAALALSLVVPAAGRLLRPDGAWAEPLTALYSGFALLAAVLLLAGLVRRAQYQELDAVIELAETDRDAVAAALRDAAAPGRTRGDAAGLLAAADLLEANARLQAGLASRVAEVAASRARLVAAGVTERRRLQEELDGGPGRYLEELRAVLRALDAGAAQDEVRGLVAACDAEAGRTAEDLAQLGRGLHPRLLVDGGLRPALLDLASRCPLPVEVRAPDRRFPEPVETAVWYACAEALTNAVKHARATTATVEVGLDGGEVAACVSDDGAGGARPTSGGGLAGLADRLAAVGGRLDLEGSAGAGTRVRIRVPLP